jgi:hypothetical protein
VIKEQRERIKQQGETMQQQRATIKHDREIIENQDEIIENNRVTKRNLLEGIREQRDHVSIVDDLNLQLEAELERVTKRLELVDKRLADLQGESKGD